MPKRRDIQTEEKAVRLEIEHRGDYSPEWAAITTVAGRLGMSAETLRKWVRQSRADAGSWVALALAAMVSLLGGSRCVVNSLDTMAAAHAVANLHKIRDTTEY